MSIKAEEFFDCDIKDTGEMISQHERRIILVLLQEDDGLPADLDPVCQLLLCQAETGPELFDPVIHSANPGIVTDTR